MSGKEPKKEEKMLSDLIKNTPWSVTNSQADSKGKAVEIACRLPSKRQQRVMVVFQGGDEEFVTAIKHIAQTFDIDDYIETAVFHGTDDQPKLSIRAIVHDAEFIQSSLRHLEMEVEYNFSRRRNISYKGEVFEDQYILDHIQEFELMLKEGYAPEHGFIQSCNIADVLGHPVLEEYGTFEQILLRIYDDNI